jgi:hypothetical protein
MKAIDHTLTSNAVCPYCGHVDRDSWELGDGSSGDEIGETECGGCGKTYVWVRSVTVDYSTQKKARKP